MDMLRGKLKLVRWFRRKLTSTLEIIDRNNVANKAHMIVKKSQSALSWGVF